MVAAITARGRSADDELVVVVMGDGRGPPLLPVAVCTYCTLPSVFAFICLPAPSTSHIYLFFSAVYPRTEPCLVWFCHAFYTVQKGGWMDDVTLIHSPLILPGIAAAAAAAPIQAGSVRSPGAKARRYHLGKGQCHPLGRPPKPLPSAGVIPSSSSVFPKSDIHILVVVVCVCVGPISARPSRSSLFRTIRLWGTAPGLGRVRTCTCVRETGGEAWGRERPCGRVCRRWFWFFWG